MTMSAPAPASGFAPAPAPPTNAWQLYVSWVLAAEEPERVKALPPLEGELELLPTTAFPARSAKAVLMHVLDDTRVVCQDMERIRKGTDDDTFFEDAAILFMTETMNRNAIKNQDEVPLSMECTLLGDADVQLIRDFDEEGHWEHKQTSLTVNSFKKPLEIRRALFDKAFASFQEEKNVVVITRHNWPSVVGKSMTDTLRRIRATCLESIRNAHRFEQDGTRYQAGILINVDAGSFVKDTWDAHVCAGPLALLMINDLKGQMPRDVPHLQNVYAHTHDPLLAMAWGYMCGDVEEMVPAAEGGLKDALRNAFRTSTFRERESLFGRYDNDRTIRALHAYQQALEHDKARDWVDWILPSYKYWCAPLDHHVPLYVLRALNEGHLRLIDDSTGKKQGGVTPYVASTMQRAVELAAQHGRLPRVSPADDGESVRSAGDVSAERERWKQAAKEPRVAEYARKYVAEKRQSWTSSGGARWTSSTVKDYEQAVLASLAHRALVVVVRPNGDAFDHEFNTEWPDFEALRRHRVLCVYKVPGTSNQYEPWVPRPYVQPPPATRVDRQKHHLQHSSVGEYVQHLARMVRNVHKGENPSALPHSGSGSGGGMPGASVPGGSSGGGARPGAFGRPSGVPPLSASVASASRAGGGGGGGDGRSGRGGGTPGAFGRPSGVPPLSASVASASRAGGGGGGGGGITADLTASASETVAAASAAAELTTPGAGSVADAPAGSRSDALEEEDSAAGRPPPPASAAALAAARVPAVAAASSGDAPASDSSPPPQWALPPGTPATLAAARRTALPPETPGAEESAQMAARIVAELAAQASELVPRATTNYHNKTIEISIGDIAMSSTQAVVNAANSNSFTKDDEGVSKALRKAAGGEAADRVHKELLDGKGNVHTVHVNLKTPTREKPFTFIPELFAGVQRVEAGVLKDRGVKYIIHAVGPKWTKEDGSTKSLQLMQQQIERTYLRALDVCVWKGVKSVTIPLISTGSFARDAKERLEIEEITIINTSTQALFNVLTTHLRDERSSLERVNIVVIDEQTYGLVKSHFDTFVSLPSVWQRQIGADAGTQSAVRRKKVMSNMATALKRAAADRDLAIDPAGTDAPIGGQARVLQQ